MSKIIDTIEVDGEQYALQDKYADSVSKFSPSLDVEIINMFNINDSRIRKDVFIQGFDVKSQQGYFISHPIKVNKGITYKFNVDSMTVYTQHMGWTLDGITVSELLPAYANGTGVNTFTADRTGYILYSSSYKISCMFCEESKYPTQYVPYMPTLPYARIMRENIVGEQPKIYPDQTTFCAQSVNIYNKDVDNNLSGYFYMANGSFAESKNFKVTGPVRVIKNKTYKYPHDSGYGTNKAVMYVTSEADMTMRRIIEGTQEGEYLVFTADEDGLVRLNTRTAFDELVVAEADKFPESYVPYKLTLDEAFDLNEKQKQTVRNTAAEQVELSNPVKHYRSANLFDYTKAVDGYYFSTNGAIVAHAKNSITYVQLDGAGVYVTKVNTGLFGFTLAAILPLFDKEHNFVGTATGILDDTTTQREDCLLTISIDNAKAYYAGLTTYTALLQDVMFVKSDTYPEQYIAFEEYNYIEGLKIQGDVTVQSPLFKKRISFNGDSICAGAGALGGYGKIIADRNSMYYQNIGVGGGTITAEQYSADSGKARHWISRTIDKMNADADYAILEGGVNDASLGVPMGEIKPNYKNNNWSFDDTTFCGAFESMLYQLITRFAGKKVGYIFVHKMTELYRSDNADDGTSYYWAAKKCCEKWGVPYLDLNITVPPFAYFRHNTSDELKALVTKYTANGDGWHPNEEGYKKYYCDQIEAWLQTL